MTGLLIAGALALVAAIGVALGARIGKVGWEPVAAALLIGLAGYAWQGRPALEGKPVSGADSRKVKFDEDMANRRHNMGERISAATPWLVLSDGLARQGDTQDSANVLARALDHEPKDANLWVGLGNALVLHGEGVLSPAAEYSYQQALRLAPDAPSPRFFYGLALAQSGRLEAARAAWGPLAAAFPPGNPFRAELENNLASIDELLRRQGAAAAPRNP